MAGEDKPRVIIKRKKGHAAAHHGGAWKVAYADFVTAMMALFIVLWLLTQADMQMKQQIAQYFRDPGILPSGSFLSPDSATQKEKDPKLMAKELIVLQGDAEQEALEGEKKSLDQAMDRAMKENPELAMLRDQVIVQVTDAGLSIQVVDVGRDMLFDLSSAKLKPALMQLLKHIAAELGRLPNHIQVGGHTDSRPFPTDATISNWELAFARANAARRVMEANGLWPGQINRVVGYADSEPLIPTDPLADENRRLSILAQRQGPLPGRAAPCDPDGGGKPVAATPDPVETTAVNPAG
jgi:chemotaxis protein MotB